MDRRDATVADTLPHLNPAAEPGYLLLLDAARLGVIDKMFTALAGQPGDHGSKPDSRDGQVPHRVRWTSRALMRVTTVPARHRSATRAPKLSAKLPMMHYRQAMSERGTVAADTMSLPDAHQTKHNP